MQKKLDNKVIVVSGGTKGVGRTMVEEYARAGANVVFGGRDSGAAKRQFISLVLMIERVFSSLPN